MDRVTEISRLAPSLVGEDGRDAGPIDDPFVSRQPIAVRRLRDGGVRRDLRLRIKQLAIDGQGRCGALAT